MVHIYMCLSHMHEVDLQNYDHSLADVDGPLQDGAQNKDSALNLYFYHGKAQPKLGIVCGLGLAKEWMEKE